MIYNIIINKYILYSFMTDIPMKYHKKGYDITNYMDTAEHYIYNDYFTYEKLNIFSQFL